MFSEVSCKRITHVVQVQICAESRTDLVLRLGPGLRGVCRPVTRRVLVLVLSGARLHLEGLLQVLHVVQVKTQTLLLLLDKRTRRRPLIRLQPAGVQSHTLRHRRTEKKHLKSGAISSERERVCVCV